MIKHIVMWKLKASAEGGTKSENALKMKAQIDSLVGIVPSLRSAEVGINFETSDAAYDLCLVSEFDDEAGLASYQNHPIHKQAADFIKKVSETRVLVDYRI